MNFPNVPVLLEDEVLYSYFLRTIFLNGFSSVSEYKQSGFWNDENNDEAWPHRSKNGMLSTLNSFVKSFGLTEDEETKLAYATTLLPALVPLVDKKDVPTPDMIFHYESSVVEYSLQLFRSGTDLRVCPVCKAEDKRRFGFFYFHRVHQMPGVTVCVKHHCALQRFKGKRDLEFDENQYEELPIYKRSYEYAAFCSDFLFADIHASNEDLRCIIKNEAIKIGYTASNYQAAKEDTQEYQGILRCSFVKYITDAYEWVRRYLVYQNTLAMLSFIFRGDVERLKISLEELHNKPESNNLLSTVDF